MNDIQAFANIIDAIMKGLNLNAKSDKLKKYAPQIEAFKTQLQNPDITLDAVKNILSEIVKICNKVFPRYEKAIFEALKELSKTEQYRPMLQGKGTNALAHASQKKAEVDTITKIASLETPGQVLIKIENFADRNLNVQTRQLLDILTLKMTSVMPHAPTAEQVKQNRVVTLTVEEFMKWRGLKDKKEARKQLEETARTLYSISLEWDEEHLIIPNSGKRAKKTILHHRMRIADNTISDFEKPIKNGAIEFKFSFDLAEYLGNAYIMQYPHALFTLNSHKNPHSYYLGRKLTLHYNMNIDKENSNRISVQSLLDACPEMPTYEQVMNNSKDGHVMKKIIEPFERDMNALLDSGILKSWEYCNSGGVPLTDEQLADYSYEVWASWLVHFELANYPDITARLKKIESRKKIADKTQRK